MDFQTPLPRPSPIVSILSLMVRAAPTGWKFYNRSILFRRQYGEMDQAPPPDGVQSAWAGPKEIEYIDKHPEAPAPGTSARRVARGDRCMCLMQDGEVIAYQWVTRRSACLFCGFGPRRELQFFTLQPHQLFTYDSYTYAAYRRKGYGTVIRRTLHKAMHDAGVREAYSLVAPENTASISLTLQSRFEPLCMAYGFRIRGWGKMILGPMPDPELQRWIADFKLREGICRPTHDTANAVATVQQLGR